MSYYDVNSNKKNFDSVYNGETPFYYLREMERYEYQIPESSKSVTEAILSVIQDQSGQVNVIDVGCSYGVNASVLKYGMSMRELYARYASNGRREDLIEKDRAHYAASGQARGLNFIGFDCAPNAVKYALDTGLIESGWCANFELNAPAASDVKPSVEKLRSIDVILSTGCVGYITERTFEGILSAMQYSSPKIVIAYVLRMFDYAPIADCLHVFGYRTVKLADQSFKQRLSASEEEHRFMLQQIKALCGTPTGDETSGYLCADLYISWRHDMPSLLQGWDARTIGFR